MSGRGRLFGTVLVLALAAGAYATRDTWQGWLGRPASTGDQTREDGRTEGRGAGRRGHRPDGPVAVVAVAAQTADVPVAVDGVGTVRPLQSVTVRPQVDGRLVAVLFREGQDVKRGDVLARIDDTLYRAVLDQALARQQQDQATLANAQADLQRYTGLIASNSVSRQQVDTQRATVAQTEALLKSDAAAIESAQATLGYTEIRAPIDGRTGIRTIDEGNLLHASDAAGIVTLSQIRPIAVLFSVPQQDLSGISRASAAGPLAVEALSTDAATVADRGTLTVVDNQVDSTTGTVRLKAEFPNADLSLWPGAFVNARLTVNTLRGVVVVPSVAVQRGPNGAFVYAVQPGDTVRQVAVTIGQQDDARAVVTAGAQAGDRVVTTGFAQLEDGAKVSVSTPDAPNGAPSSGSETTRSPGTRPGQPVRSGHRRRDASPSAEGASSPAPERAAKSSAQSRVLGPPSQALAP